MKRTMLKAFTMMWLFGMQIVLVSTFLSAYQIPEKAVIVEIDNYNEADIELFIVLGSLFLTTVGMFYVFSDINNNLAQRRLKKLMDETLSDDSPAAI